MSRLKLNLAFCLLLTGCYVPPFWDIGDEIHSVGSIEEGVTTKEEVLSTSGQPHQSWDDACGKVFWYDGDYSEGYFAISDLRSSYGGLINEERWWFAVFFYKKIWFLS